MPTGLGRVQPTVTRSDEGVSVTVMFNGFPIGDGLVTPLYAVQFAGFLAI